MAYTNVIIASPRFVLDKRLIRELIDTLYNTIYKALDDYLYNSYQLVILLAPLAPIEPLLTPLPPKELLSPYSPAIEPPTNKSNSYIINYSPINEPL
jgi:hypothetical protein